MGRRRNSALLKDQEQFTMASNRKNQTFYQKHEGNQNSNTISFNQAKKQRKSIDLIPKTINQEQYILALQNEATDVVVATGPAGTGKTFLAMLATLAALRNKQCDRVVLCRPAISVEGENHGFLPGDLTAKLEPWVKPMIDILREFYTMKEIEYMLEEEIIEFAPLGMMRGRTFKNTWLILDEAQNASPPMIKMLLTRLGQGSKIIITGDIEQGDRKSHDNGLLDLRDKLNTRNIPGIETCEFDQRDIQRHRLIGEILKLYR